MNEFLYASYRRNLRRNQHKPPGKARNLHHLERAAIIWPIHLYLWWQRKRKPTPGVQSPHDNTTPQTPTHIP